MKILVTGCAGFIGFHLCNNLVNKHIRIFGVDNLNDYYSPSIKKSRLSILKKNKNFRFYKKDISNYKAIEKIFAKNKFDIIFNLAAQAGVRYSIENPREYIKSNILGFCNLIELARLYDVKKFFYASSSSVYGEKRTFPLKENQAIHPTNTYSLSKKNNEEIAEIYSNYYNIKFVGLRFFTIYGEWGRPDMLILKFISSIRKKKTFFLNNFGNHFRDFTYINDVIKNLKILLFMNLKKKHEIYNVCSGKPVDIKYILRKLTKQFGNPIIKKRKKLNADVLKTHGCNKKLKKKTKYYNYTNIDDGLKNLVDWAKNKKNIQNY